MYILDASGCNYCRVLEDIEIKNDWKEMAQQ